MLFTCGLMINCSSLADWVYEKVIDNVLTNKLVETTLDNEKDIFEAVYRESNTSLPHLPLHNKHIHWFQNKDTTPISISSKLYIFENVESLFILVSIYFLALSTVFSVTTVRVLIVERITTFVKTARTVISVMAVNTVISFIAVNTVISVIAASIVTSLRVASTVISVIAERSVISRIVVSTVIYVIAVNTVKPVTDERTVMYVRVVSMVITFIAVKTSIFSFATSTVISAIVATTVPKVKPLGDARSLIFYIIIGVNIMIVIAASIVIPVLVAITGISLVFKRVPYNDLIGEYKLPPLEDPEIEVLQLCNRNDFTVSEIVQPMIYPYILEDIYDKLSQYPKSKWILIATVENEDEDYFPSYEDGDDCKLRGFVALDFDASAACALHTALKQCKSLKHLNLRGSDLTDCISA